MFYKKFTFLLCLFLSALSLYANDADIKAFIEANSDVKVEIQNDLQNPWTVDETKLNAPSSSSSYLTITYESDSVTTIEIKKSGCSVYVDGTQLSKESINVAKGKHTIKISGYKGYYVSSLSISYFSTESNNANIKAFIEANSDVKVEIQNNYDLLNPWTVDETKLKSPSVSSDSYLTITYESDSVTTIEIKKSGCYVYVDGTELSKKSINVAKGKHTIEIKGYNGNYVSSLSISYTGTESNNADIKAFIEANSDVEVEIQNDLQNPWTVDETKLNAPSVYSYLTITYESDSASTIEIKKTGCSVYVDGTQLFKESINAKKSINVAKGKHTIKIGGYEDDYISYISIKTFNFDADIKALIEANSDVKVEIQNDSLVPCYLPDTNSIIVPEGSKLSIKYSSNKITKFNYESKGNCTIYIDGEKYNPNLQKYFYLPTKGEHEIILEGGSGGTFSNISIIEIDSMQAMEQEYVKTSCYPKEFYDYDGDGYFECNSSYTDKYDPITTLWNRILNLSAKEWININNDDYIDIYNSGYGIIKSDSLYETTTFDVTGTYFDYNNDGYPDFSVFNSSSKVPFFYTADTYTFKDSSYTTTKIKLMSFNEYNDNLVKKKYTVGLSDPNALDYAENMIVSPSALQARQRAAEPNQFIDINGDGIPDFINHYDQKMIINLGNGEGVFSEVSGEMYDLNADGKMDLIGFDGQNIICYLVQNDGSFLKKKLCQTGVIHDELWCYDFDKDGDKDILLAFKYKKSWQGSYLFMLENKGNFEYQSHEYFYNNAFISAPQCIDFDNDGYYELIWGENLDINIDFGKNGKCKLCYININGMNIAETPIYFDVPIRNIGYWSNYENRLNFYGNAAVCSIFDIDNDGIMDLFTSENSSTGPGHRILLSQTPNAKPNKPNAPRLTYEKTSGLLSINWDLGTDKESSSIDLTYALRIGSEPGKGDILYAHAKPDGTRKNLLGGNHSTNRYRIINTNTWKAGKYYISVQAVDPNNRGSEFSEEVVFEKTTNAAAFELIYNIESFGVGDTCNIILHPNVLEDTNHHVVFTNGRIVATSDDNLTLQVVFTEPGEQKISLCTKNENGESIITCYKNIEVAPFSATYLSGALFAMDLDEDGYMEYNAGTNGFYTYDSLGNVSRINKMFNNNTILSELKYGGHTIDLNKDGKCDVISSTSQRIFRIFNNGNKNMTIDSEYIWFDGNFSGLLDLNNDGWFDIIHGYQKVSIASSGYDSFEYLELEDRVFYSKDFTNDGLIDFINYNNVVYENNGDFTFTPIDTLPISYSSNYFIMKDFDGDKKIDYLFDSRSNDTTKIVWGNGTETIFDQSINIDENRYLFDFNNDGYIDICGSKMVGDREENGVILILPNQKYQFVRYDLSSNYGDLSTFIISDSIIQCGYYLLNKANSRPSAPTNLSAGYTDKGVMITWDHSCDAETPTGHMRYNISIKHKGKTGEYSYFISPCNSTKNGVHVPSALPLIEGNRFLIPTASIPVGEYEVQVQGVDLLGLESNFSEIYNLVVSENVVIKAPSVTGVNTETTISIATNITDNINWDGGKVISSENGKYIVIWETEGIKNITVGKNKQQIHVKNLPNAEFTLPSEVMMLATVKGLATNPREGEWTISSDSVTFIQLTKSNLVEILSTDTTSIILRFNKAGHYTIRHTISSYYGIGVYEQNITVNEEHIMPEISTVTNTDGYYQITWENSDDMPTNVIGYKIYKETSYTDVYELLYETDLNTTSYTDLLTNSNAQSERYTISYVTSYGESQKSKPHQGIHVMINKGVGNSWNLAWFKYEGRDVASYRIWRGTKPDQLSIIDEISGNMTSFSDLKTNDSVYYYAVEVIFKNEITPQKQSVRYRAKEKNNISSMSNVISTEMAQEVTFVENIIIKGDNIVIGENNTTQLSAYIHPYYASYKSVNWVIEDGAEYAQINNNGLLSILNEDINNNTDIVVKAYALDGSNVSAETTIYVSNPRLYTITYMVDGQVYRVNYLKSNEWISYPTPYKQGYVFVEWVGLPSIMPAQNIVVEAKFELDMYYTYSVRAICHWGGTVSGGGSYTYGTTVSLAATPDKGCHFVQWSDGNTENPRTITVTKAISFIAEFAVNQYQVTLDSDGNGFCNGSNTYNYGTEITIEALAYIGYHFVQWSDGNTENPRTITVTEDINLTAEFAINQYQVTLDFEGSGSVTGSGTYDYGTEITIEATANTGYRFVQWSDSITENPRIIGVYRNINLTAEFAIDQYQVTLKSNGNGSVTGSGTYDYGTEITIEAIANENYHFVRWSDGNTENPRTITVTEDMSLIAEFIANQYQITLESDGNGSVTGSGTYDYGTKVTIEAIADKGYHFVKWSDNTTENPRVIVVTKDINLTATFELDGTPVEDVLITSANVYSHDGKLHVEGAETDYYVLDMAGRLIYSGRDTQIQLPHGVYVVSVNGEVQKVVL